MDIQTAVRLVVAVSVTGGCALLMLAVWGVHAMDPVTAGTLAVDRLDESGVDHPVTAVLLNFRGYDTLLEVVVLVVAFWGVWSLRVRRPPAFSTGRGVLFRRVSGLLIPVFLMLVLYLLWAGAHRPGGEFQAGAVLGAAGVMVLLVGRAVPGARRLVVRQLSVVVGAGVFLVVAAAGWVATGEMFGYAEGTEPVLMFVIEVAVVVSVGFILVALFAGSVARLCGDLTPTPVGPGELTGPDQAEYRSWAAAGRSAELQQRADEEERTDGS